MSLTPNETAAILPLAIPAVAACLIPIASLDRDQSTQKWIRAAIFAIAIIALGASFWYTTRIWGSGMQPSYRYLSLDRLAQFAAIFVQISAVYAVLQLWDHLHHEGWVKGEILALLLFSVVGMMLFAATSNLVLMFLALELFSIPLYALTAIVRVRTKAFEGGVKYFLTGAVASSCFLMGIVLLYGMTGSFDLNVIAQSLAKGVLDPLALLGAALLLMGFVFKVSAAPFHQWTPDAYEAAPHPIAGFMSVATKGIAIIALIRVFGAHLVPIAEIGSRAQTAFAALAVITLIIGNLAALSQTNFKRMLAYSSISHAGYLLLGFVAGTTEAHQAILFYLCSYLLMNLGAFGLLSAFGLVGDDTQFRDMRGLGWKRPGIGVAATICFLSLAGIPPTAGFIGKYLLFKELILQGHVVLAIIAIVASLVSVAYYLKPIIAMYMEPPKEDSEPVIAPFAGATVLVSGVLIIVLGLIPGRLLDGLVKPSIIQVQGGAADAEVEVVEISLEELSPNQLKDSF
ncbi:MAG: NADH-quinone oxidoreductase subunit N [Holophagales bacterium]|jgi:NADH-quinone oxidoreductase subunit N|nr:NADH-quinone oxidoreductase subunit N [Holophagales bacterium]